MHLLKLRQSKVKCLSVIGGSFRGFQNDQKFQFLVRSLPAPYSEGSLGEFELKLSYDPLGQNTRTVTMGNFRLSSLGHFWNETYLSMDQVFWFLDHHRKDSLDDLLGRMFDEIMNLQIHVQGEGLPLIFRTWLTTHTQTNSFELERSIPWGSFPFITATKPQVQLAEAA